MNSVLIISGTEDAHAKHMCSILERRDIPYFLFPTDYPKALEEMVGTEAKLTLRGFMQTHRGRVVNRPLANSYAENKSEQLVRARRLGFHIPDTIITNSPEQAIGFYKKHGRDIIFKMQRLPIIQLGEGNHRTIMTRRVSEQDLEDLERIQNCPCMFQERIPKTYEIRLTVIGEKLFPIAIHSQNSDYSQDDFRRYDFEKVKYEQVEIPEILNKRVLGLVKSYGLYYAAIDIIYTPSKEYVFLEINSNGQYLWTEEMSGVPITEYFADYLAGVSNG